MSTKKITVISITAALIFSLGGWALWRLDTLAPPLQDNKSTSKKNHLVSNYHTSSPKNENALAVAAKPSSSTTHVTDRQPSQKPEPNSAFKKNPKTHTLHPAVKKSNSPHDVEGKLTSARKSSGSVMQVARQTVNRTVNTLNKVLSL